MKILFLGPDKDSLKRIINFLFDTGEIVFRYEKKIEHDKINIHDYDFLISYGYRFIISKEILRHFNENAINLHISYLPWNGGADPNLWSILECTPKGVSIHQLDEGIDTGDILCQRKITFDEDDTLRRSYEKLEKEMEALFIERWTRIKNHDIQPVRQKGRGSYHKSKDKEQFAYLLSDGWDTKIAEIQGKALLND